MPTDHCHAANAAKLMNANRAGKEGPFVDGHVATQQTLIGHDDVAGQTAIVSDVSTGHEETIVANRRGGFRLHGPMDGDVLAQGVAFANDNAANFFGTAHMLRHTADHGAFANRVAIPQAHAIFNAGLARDPATIADDDIVFNNGERANAHVGADLSLRTDNRQGVDIHRRESSGGVGGRRDAGEDRCSAVNQCSITRNANDEIRMTKKALNSKFHSLVV
jgi:hypothetical protein